MTYAIEILEADRKLLVWCLEGWPKGEYPDALKDRDRKLKQIDKAIQILKDYGT